MRLLIFALSLIAWTAQGAITEIYASAAGAGGHTGADAANAFNFVEMVADINAGSKAGNRYNYKDDIANTTTNITISGSGTATAPVIIRGYKTSIGDGYQGRSNGNGALVTTNMPNISFTSGALTISGNFILLESINFTSTKNGNAFSLSGADMVCRGCRFANAASGSLSVSVLPANARFYMQNSDVILSNGGNAGSIAIYFQSSNGYLVGNRITSSSIGVNNTAASASFLFNTIYNCAGVSVTNSTTGGSLELIGNTITGGTLDAVGFLTGNTASSMIVNNCITDNGGWAVNFGATSTKAMVANNRTVNNVSGQYTNYGDWPTGTSWGAVTTAGGAGADYVNAGSQDYRLASTSPAIGAGIPLYMSMGALQVQVTSGSTTTVVHSFPIFQ